MCFLGLGRLCVFTKFEGQFHNHEFVEKSIVIYYLGTCPLTTITLIELNVALLGKNRTCFVKITYMCAKNHTCVLKITHVCLKSHMCGKNHTCVEFTTQEDVLEVVG